ncbi:MAG: ATP-binding protein [Sandaracinus sp.]
MSLREGVQLAEAGLFLYVALWFGILYGRRLEARENGLFAAIALGNGVAALGTGFVVGAQSLADAALGQRCLHAGILGAVGALALLVDVLTGERRPWLRALAGLTFVFTCLASAGAFFDPTFPAPSYDESLAATPTARLTLVGLLGLATGVLVFLVTTLVMGERARARRSDRPVFLAMLVPLACGVYDVLSRVLGLPTLHLSSLGAAFLVIAMSHVLAQRLVEVDRALERKREELEEAHASLRAAENTLVRTEQLAAIGELSAVIAHEIRNPLAILKNAASGLSRENVGESDRETLLTILDQEADRLNRLVNDLLAYASPLVADARPTDLVALVRAAAQHALESHPLRTDIEIDVLADPPPHVAWADPALLRHALINIVDNAILAMPQGGLLTIRLGETVRHGYRYVAIAFEDQGEGMDTIVRKRARDVFFTTRSSGTGLGLAIVDRVARVHRGFVDIESRHGQGTTVTLYVPTERGSTPPPMA